MACWVDKGWLLNYQTLSKVGRQGGAFAKLAFL